MANPLVVVISFLMCVLFSTKSQAQTVMAEVVGEFPYVYSHPDFDAPVIANLKPGAKVQVSKQLFGYNSFHRIQLPNVQGFVSSAEIRVLVAKAQAITPPSEVDDITLDAEIKEKAPKSKPISVLRYQGLIIETINYTEDTMSKTRNEPLAFIGYRVLGYNTLFSGEMSTDLSILYHHGAPSYYERVTGYPVTGNIFNAHFTFDTNVPLSRDVMVSYGFGPMIRYSHYEVNLKNAAGVGLEYFALDDMTLGVLFRLGGGVRLGGFSLRADAKYYIESKQYAGVNVSTLFEF